MTIRICVAGATGWVGKELIRTIYQPDTSEKFTLAASVARTAGGKHIGEILHQGLFFLTNNLPRGLKRITEN